MSMSLTYNNVKRGVRDAYQAFRSNFSGSLFPPDGTIVTPSATLDAHLHLLSDNLDFKRLRSIVNSALRGDLEVGLTLFSEMQRKDPRLQAVANIRRMALTLLDYEIVSAAEDEDDGVDRTLADEAAQFVREQISDLMPFGRALEHMARGIGPNLAVLEKVWEGRKLVDLIPVHETRLATDSKEPWRIRIRTDDNHVGVFATPEKFVIHMPHGEDRFPFRLSPLISIAPYWLGKSISFADLIIYNEIFGMPMRWVKHRANASKSEINTLMKMLKSMGSSAFGAFSENVDLSLLESSQRGTSPHTATIELCDRQYAVAFLGGNLTTDTTGGTGTFAAASVQDEVRDDIRDDDIQKEARTIREQIIEPMCRYQFWRGDVPCPHFRRNKKQVVTVQDIKDAQLAGIDMPKDWALARLGIPKLKDGEEKLEPMTGFFGDAVSEGFDA